MKNGGVMNGIQKITDEILISHAHFLIKWRSFMERFQKWLRSTRAVKTAITAQAQAKQKTVTTAERFIAVRTVTTAKWLPDTTKTSATVLDARNHNVSMNAFFVLNARAVHIFLDATKRAIVFSLLICMDVAIASSATISETRNITYAINPYLKRNLKKKRPES
jgi:hypothetical protein